MGCSLLVLDEGEYSGGHREDAGVDGSADGAPPEDAAHDTSHRVEDGGPDGDAGSSAYANTVLADSPVLYLRFGESSGTTARAVVGVDGAYGVAGYSLGAPGAIAGDPDTAVTLTDGAGRFIVPDFAFDGVAPFSVEIWAKPAQANTDLGFVVDHTFYAEPQRAGWSLFVGESGVAYDRWATVDIRTSLRRPALAANQWHHVVGTFDGTRQRLYVDGARIAEGTSDVALPSRASALTIGNQSCDCGGVNAFIGALDELAIYDKALTDTQISAHFAAAK